jgi:hypothetical protein
MKYAVAMILLSVMCDNNGNTGGLAAGADVFNPSAFIESLALFHC